MERMFANGLGRAGGAPVTGVFRPPVSVVGLVGVPGEGLEAGLTPEKGGKRLWDPERHTRHL